MRSEKNATRDRKSADPSAEATKGKKKKDPRSTLANRSFEEFERAVRAKGKHEVLDAALGLNIDVETIMREKYDKFKRLSIPAAVLTTLSAINTAIEDARSDSVKLILAGSFDRNETKSKRHPPMTVVGLAGSGDHKAFTTFEPQLQLVEGSVEYSFPSFVEILYTESTKDGYTRLNIRKATSVEPIVDRDTILNALARVAIEPQDINTDEHEDSVVVVRGILNRVTTASMLKFVEGEDESGQWVRSGDYEVLEQSGKNPNILNPAVQFALRGVESDEYGDITYVRGSMTKTYIAEYYVDFPDLEELLYAAVESTDIPRQQAELVSEALRGHEVYLIGYVGKSRIRPDKTTKGDAVLYVDINLSGIVSTGKVFDQEMNDYMGEDLFEFDESNDDSDDGSDSDDGTGRPEETKTKTRPKKKPPEEKMGDDTEEKTGDDQKDTTHQTEKPSTSLTEDKPIQPEADTALSECIKNVEAFSELSGRSLSTFTPEELQSAIQGGKFSLALIRTALEMAKEKQTADQSAPGDN